MRPLSEGSRRRRVAENDHAVSGTVIHWRTLHNSQTTKDVVWIYLQTGQIKLEVLVNRADLEGELKRGARFSADVWLQGHILSERELEARYEGVDIESPRGDFWNRLRRDN